MVEHAPARDHGHTMPSKKARKKAKHEAKKQDTLHDGGRRLASLAGANVDALFTVDNSSAPLSKRERASRANGFLPFGVAWYRAWVPPATALRTWLEIDGVAHSGSIYLDGKLIGNHHDGYVRRRFPLDNCSASAQHGAARLLAVRADASEPKGWWYAGGGLTRAVRLCTTAASTPLLVHDVNVGMELGAIKSNAADVALTVVTTLSTSVEMDQAEGREAARRRSEQEEEEVEAHCEGSFDWRAVRVRTRIISPTAQVVAEATAQRSPDRVDRNATTRGKKVDARIGKAAPHGQQQLLTASLALGFTPRLIDV